MNHARLIGKIKNMSVAWFSFNLATSAIILSSFALANLEHATILKELAKILAYINTATFAIIAIFYSIRVVIGWKSFSQMLRHPVQGPFLSVIPIATMLLSLDWSLVLNNITVASVFFYAGLILHTILFIIIMYRLERHPGIEVRYMNPGWYMPAVGNVLVPYVGAVLIAHGVHISRSLMGIYLGTGTIMWISLFTIWLYRAIFYSPPPPRLMATTWINLAPPTVIPLSYEALLGFTPDVYKVLIGTSKGVQQNPAILKLLISFFDFFYYTFWGVAGLLLTVIIAITVDYLVKRQVEFAESWWAFVFPLAAYTISTIHLYLHHTEDRWLVYYAWFLYILTWISYLVTTALSIYYGIEELKSIPEEELPATLRPLQHDLEKTGNNNIAKDAKDNTET
jgi:C4-dicarboxylate transporter/malic acid transport protein